MNGNKLEKVPSVYKDGKLTFFTNHFSLYTIVKSKTVASDQNTSVPTNNNNKPSNEPSTPTKPNSGETPVQPEAPGSNEKPKAETGEALVQPELPELKEIPKAETGEALIQPELPELNINELNKDKKVETEKPVDQKTSQTAVKRLKTLANTGVNSTATVGLGALVLLSALVLRRKNNK